MILTVDEARVLRALDISGRRLLRGADGWSVHARGDARTRSLARLDFASAARLLASGRLREAPGGGLVRADTAPCNNTNSAHAREPTPDLAFQLASAPHKRARGAGFQGLVRQAERGEGPLTRRAAAAGIELIKDAETSTRQSGLVMNWSAIPSDRDARRVWRGGGVDAGARARIKLSRIRARAGDPSFSLSWLACVEARSLKWLAKRYGFPSRTIADRLAHALESLADAYEN